MYEVNQESIFLLNVIFSTEDIDDIIEFVFIYLIFFNVDDEDGNVIFRLYYRLSQIKNFSSFNYEIYIKLSLHVYSIGT